MQDEKTKETPTRVIHIVGGCLIACLTIALLWPVANDVVTRFAAHLHLHPQSHVEHTSVPITRIAEKPANKKVKDEAVSFNKDIRPILSDNCFACHGLDKKKREADLRLDTFAGATQDFGGYAAVVPGNRKESEIWLRINDKTDPMPPKKHHGQTFHKRLTQDEIELIGQWIDSGAAYKNHWAYEPLSRPELPEVSNPAWSKNPLDRFVLAKLDRYDIKPAPRADKRTLLRRVTYDLTGLPPTPQQVQAFLEDKSPGAYEAYVQSLLKAPAYGEHLAVWWLDLVRYADTKGFHGDQERTVWPYRDWVIRSLNDNMPFDRFTVMQLAGDLMQDEPTRDMLIASAYNRLAPQTEEGGAQHKEYEAIYNADRVTNYGEVWLGSSTGCAACHDHKFDPFTTKDFYSLAAFFADINQQIIGHRSGYARHSPPYVLVPQHAAQAEQVEAHDKRYRAFIKQHPQAMVLEEKLTSRDYIPPVQGLNLNNPEYKAELDELLKERSELAKKVPPLIVTRALQTPRTVRVLARGNWQDDTGQVVQPATPAFLGGPSSTEDHRLNRLDLAKWTVSPDNPLTARAITNRLWARYLASPLSSNTVDLGSQGTVPTHPQMLDWMSVEFIESGWDLRHIIRLIVTSETYKQSSDNRQELAIIDPANHKLFARQSALRLSAEELRDQALSVSGLLTDRIGGPSVFPYQPKGHWEPLNFPRRKWTQSKGDDLYRRGVYTWMQRTFPHPMMTAFDAPSRESCTGQRMVSVTPLQALGLLNGPTFVESARVLAQRLVSEHDSDADRLAALYQRVLARPPRNTERKMLSDLLASQRKHFTAHPEDAAKLAAFGEAPPVADGLDSIDVAVWTSVCRVVLNLHETMTRN